MQKCVVIGCGWAGTRHMEAIANHPGAVLSGVCDTDEEKLSYAAKKYNVRGFKSIEELRDEDFDAGMVCTLPMIHKDLCIRLMEMGKSVICEKPLGRTLKDVEAVADVALKCKARMGVAFNQRKCLAVQKARELMDADGGRIHMITASMYQNYPRKIGGHIEEDFIITDGCCHLLDLMTYFGGEVKSVSALNCKVESEIFSDVVAGMEFVNGGAGSMTHTMVGGKFESQHPAMQIDIHTDRFRFVIENFDDRLRVFPHDLYEQQVYETSVFSRRDYSISVHKAVGEFIDALNSDTDPPVGIEDAIRNIKIIEAIKQSSKSERHILIK